jgi:hypothetical protein
VIRTKPLIQHTPTFSCIRIDGFDSMQNIVKCKILLDGCSAEHTTSTPPLSPLFPALAQCKYSVRYLSYCSWCQLSQAVIVPYECAFSTWVLPALEIQLIWHLPAAAALDQFVRYTACEWAQVRSSYRVDRSLEACVLESQHAQVV